MDYDEDEVRPAPSPPESFEAKMTVLALQVLAGLVSLYLAYRYIMANRPLEATKPNAFMEKKKKEQWRQLPKPASGVKYVYRIARASEPSRTGPKGEKSEQKSARDTVGFEAAYMADRPQMLRLSDGGYYGVAGLDDKCLHLSTADQVVETVKLYFGDVKDVILLKFATAHIEKDEDVDLKWEQAMPPPGVTARPDAFPHVYSKERGVKAKLSWWDLVACYELPLGADGAHVFPPDALSEADVPQPDLPSLVGAPRGAQKPAPEAEEEEEKDELTKLEEQLRKEHGL